MPAVNGFFQGVFKAVAWRLRAGRQYLFFARARLHRARLRRVVFVGITGSAGKTTTKDLAAAVLSTAGACARTELSRNEPKHAAGAVLRTTRSDRFSVIEMSGANPGELDYPIRLVRPRIVALTLIGRDHYSAFRSLEGIAAEKGKLVSSLPRRGTAVLNIDDPFVREIGKACRGRIIWVGASAGATVRLLEAASRWPEPLTLSVAYEGQTHTIRTQLHGTHLALPVISALGIALAAGMPMEQAVRGLQQVPPSAGRMEVVTDRSGVHFVRDDWKAPQWALQAALDFIKAARARRKVIVIGTISDSPNSPKRRYRHAARAAREAAGVAVFVGRDAHHALAVRERPDDDSVLSFGSVREAAVHLNGYLEPGDLVLLKGSTRSDHLARRLLDRLAPVQCWRDDCQLSILCENCPQLHDAGDTREEHARPDSQEPVTGRLTEWMPELGDLPPGAAVTVVAGLGNAGAENAFTRHNIGFRVLDAMAETCGGTWVAVPEGTAASVRLSGGAPLVLFKASARMNATGPKIRRFLERADASHGDCIVVHDDMDLMFGSVRLRREGGDGGHNGVRSVIAALGSSRIRRVRLGVRSAGDGAKARGRVLEAFSPAEEARMPGVLELAHMAVRELSRARAETRLPRGRQ